MGKIAFVALAAAGSAALAFSVSDSKPAVGDLQRAYERESAIPDGKHDLDLVVLGVDCAARDDRRYFCQVGFKLTETDPDRVYLDAALIERQNGQWRLC